MSDVSESDAALEEDLRVRSPVVRVALVAAGSLFVVLGVIGIVVPGLPTTPFLLLAAACYARSSRRFYHWLISNRTFGPTIKQWRESRTIPRRSRIWAVTLTVLSFGVTIIFFAPFMWVRILLIAMMLLLVFFIMRIPVRT